MAYTARAVSNPTLIVKFVRQVFPLVHSELIGWQAFAASSAEPRLAEQALASIDAKGFHCQGGSIYALYPGTDTTAAVRFIVAYQTISDYLDNLVDSLYVHDEKAFAQLHLAMTDALDPTVPTSDYYLYYPYKADGGYLQALVETCRAEVNKLPSYDLLKPAMITLAELYSQLQTYKHLAPVERETKLLQWANTYLQDYPGISAWEFSAAAGSTLGIFCLFASASDPDLSPDFGQKIMQAYFPWICGLHILLDYFIDLAEDRETDQLNFVQYYTGQHEILERLRFFLLTSLTEASALPWPKFHRAVIQGLLAMYLSDRKTSLPEVAPVTRLLLHSAGIPARTLHWICAQLRRRQVIT